MRVRCSAFVVGAISGPQGQRKATEWMTQFDLPFLPQQGTSFAIKTPDNPVVFGPITEVVFNLATGMDKTDAKTIGISGQFVVFVDSAPWLGAALEKAGWKSGKVIDVHPVQQPMPGLE